MSGLMKLSISSVVSMRTSYTRNVRKSEEFNADPQCSPSFAQLSADKSRGISSHLSAHEPYTTRRRAVAVPSEPR